MAWPYRLVAAILEGPRKGARLLLGPGARTRYAINA